MICQASLGIFTCNFANELQGWCQIEKTIYMSFEKIFAEASNIYGLNVGDEILVDVPGTGHLALCQNNNAWIAFKHFRPLADLLCASHRIRFYMFLRWICWNCTRNPWNGNETTAWDQNTVACQHILQILRNQRWRDDSKCLFQLRLYFIVHIAIWWFDPSLSLRAFWAMALLATSCWITQSSYSTGRSPHVSQSFTERFVFLPFLGPRFFGKVDQGKAPWWPCSFHVDAIDASCLCPDSVSWTPCFLGVPSRSKNYMLDQEKTARWWLSHSLTRITLPAFLKTTCFCWMVSMCRPDAIAASLAVNNKHHLF